MTNPSLPQGYSPVLWDTNLKPAARIILLCLLQSPESWAGDLRFLGELINKNIRIVILRLRELEAEGYLRFIYEKDDRHGGRGTIMIIYQEKVRACGNMDCVYQLKEEV